MLREIISHCEKETELAGTELGRSLKPGSVVALFGGLGAGKTVFTRGLAVAAGYRGRVTSPTYAIVNEYHGAIPVFHFDMYRLRGPEELEELGWEDYLSRGGICVVEWSERIADALPEGTVRVTLQLPGDMLPEEEAGSGAAGTSRERPGTAESTLRKIRIEDDR